MNFMKKIKSPRLRFAPAPTGLLHIGGARTVLFNWLFARKHGGNFVLRIEDTDPERSRPEFEKDILDGIQWLGLDWDEGPDIGGPYGPYRQSQRRTIYEKYLAKLLETGRAYYCFCDEKDLEAERQDMIARGVPPKYSGRCRNLAKEEVDKRLKAGDDFVIRLKMPSKKVVFEDLVRGKIEFDMDAVGDIPIARSLGSPLFIFAVTVDDFEMKISHVIRGEDLLPNTPKQIILQEVLGFPQPEYGHLPVILGPDRAKLSKRHGSTAVSEYREIGYLPEAIVNFLALLGWHPQDEREIFDLTALIQEFSLERVQKGAAVFNIAKLNWMNAKYIRSKRDQDILPQAKYFWGKSGFDPEKYPEDYLTQVVSIVKERIEKLADIADLTSFFFKEPAYPKTLLRWQNMSFEEVTNSIEVLIETLSKIPDSDFSAKHIKKALEPLYLADKGRLLWPMRAALSGRGASPGPFEIAAILGKTKTLERLQHAKKLLQP